jgi:molybdopterin-synthase adenylyltransferase
MSREIAPTPSRAVLRAVPVQFVDVGGAVIIKRGRAEVKIGGERAGEVVRRVFAAAAAGANSEEIEASFAAPDRPAVAGLIAQLEARRFLVPVGDAEPPLDSSESNLDVFYWHFGSSTAQASKGLSDNPITIVGVNCVSRRLAAALQADGARNLEVVHYPLLCNLRLLDERGQLRPGEWPELAPQPREYRQWWDGLDPRSLGCLVATSDFGGLQLMRSWNEFCVRNKLHFLPIVLQDLIGYIGPLVIPGETSCFECLRARQNSHLSEWELERAPEVYSFTGQVVAGFHPSMASILGDLAAIEMSRFYVGWAPPRLVGTLIEVNFLAPAVSSRKVLRIPRCRVCALQNQRTITSPYRNTFMPGNEWPK